MVRFNLPSHSTGLIMKQLLIDVGNTNIVFSIYDHNIYSHHWRIHTVIKKTADEYEVILRSLMEKNNVDIHSIEQAVMSSVVPSLSHPMEEMVEKLLRKKLYTLSPALYDRLPIGILNPYEIGSDLVAAAVAAFQQYGGNVIVVDFGTALTFTGIASDGEILGVSIAPGMKTAIASLANNTAQLSDVPLVEPPSVLGKNTIHAIQSGVVLGYVGMVEYLIKAYKKEMPDANPMVIATGGLHYLMKNLTPVIDEYNDILTMDGLRIIGENYIL